MFRRRGQYYGEYYDPYKYSPYLRAASAQLEYIDIRKDLNRIAYIQEDIIRLKLQNCQLQKELTKQILQQKHLPVNPVVIPPPVFAADAYPPLGYYYYPRVVVHQPPYPGYVVNHPAQVIQHPTTVHQQTNTDAKIQEKKPQNNIRWTQVVQTAFKNAKNNQNQSLSKQDSAKKLNKPLFVSQMIKDTPVTKIPLTSSRYEPQQRASILKDSKQRATTQIRKSQTKQQKIMNSNISVLRKSGVSLVTPSMSKQKYQSK